VITHSPHVLSSANAGEVGMLNNKDGHLTVDFVDKDLRAWKTDYIYSDILAFDSEYDQKLADYVDEIEDKLDESDFAGALAVLDDYAKHAHPEDLTPKALRRRIEKQQKKL
jgi:hypothetical protein